MKHPENILFVSSLCSKDTQDKIFALNPVFLNIQIQKYHTLLVKGFLANKVKVKALTYLRPVKKVWEDQNTCEEDANGISYSYIIPSSDSPLRYLQVFINSFKQTRRFLKENPNGAVICDVLNVFLSLGAVAACKLAHRKVTGIITDFPEMEKEKLSLLNRFNWWIIHRYDAYVLLSELMKERLHMKNKTAIVLEGHVDADAEFRAPAETIDPSKPRICIYAGNVGRKNGIMTLVEAFKLANVPNAQLHLYGTGDTAAELEQMNDPSIVYWGKVPNQTVVDAEYNAALLINPRPTKASFTKYSFPSKNMEYMVSGTACLFTRLPSIPEEYTPYVFYFRDETLDGMAQDLHDVLSLSDEQLRARGIAARNFVLEKKNNIAQAKKILGMLETISRS